jgi:hypothetical protein
LLRREVFEPETISRKFRNSIDIDLTLHCYRALEKLFGDLMITESAELSGAAGVEPEHLRHQ